MELPYAALDVAALLSFRDLGIRAEAALLEKIWAEEQTFLAPDLAKSRRTFLLDVAYWSLYLREKPCIDREFPVIQRDAADCGAHLSEESFLSDFSNLDLYFKEVRFRLRFFSDCGYVRIKLRTLLKQYGYRRRSAKLLEHLELSNDNGTVVLSAQEQYLSNDNISEIIGGRFKVLGKVIGVCKERSDSIDLLRKTSLSILSEELLSEMFSGFQGAELSQFNLPPFKTKIDGPALIVIPIAIYA